jgi:hypothetical protein
VPHPANYCKHLLAKVRHATLGAASVVRGG